MEITERAYTESPVQLIKSVSALNELGVIIEMDYFGSGYSSLNKLSELPLDLLKIDMQFLHSHTKENRKGNILNFIISLAKWLGLSVVAEGIETHAQMVFLRSMGCNYGQGYYFSHPLSEADFSDLLHAGARDGGVKVSEFLDLVKLEEIWNPLSPFNVIFNSCMGALAIYECVGENVNLSAATTAFLRRWVFAAKNSAGSPIRSSSILHPEDRPAFMTQWFAPEAAAPYQESVSLLVYLRQPYRHAVAEDSD